MPVPARDVIRLLELEYASMESRRSDWRAANCKIVDVTEEVEASSVNVPEMHNLTMLLEKGAGWAQYVGSVDPRLVGLWG